MAYKLLDPVWYRFLEELPLEMELRGQRYRLEVHQQVQGSWDWTVQARVIGRGQVVIVSESFREREWLEEAIYRDGFAARWRTDGNDLMRALVKANRAEFLPDPHRKPEHGRGMPWNWL